MTWKYGTILRDDHLGYHMMIVREIPENIAGEKELYEAVRLDQERPWESGSWMAVSPKDSDLTEIMDPADPGVIVFNAAAGTTVLGASIGGTGVGGTFSGHLTFDDPPNGPAKDITVSWKADGTFEVT